MDIQDLLSGTKWTKVDFAGQTCKIKYNVGKATRENLEMWQARIQDLNDKDDVSASDVLKSVEAQLAELLCDWDLVNGGEPYPFNPEALAKLPEPLKNAMRMAVYQDNGTEVKKDKRKSSMTG